MRKSVLKHCLCACSAFGTQWQRHLQQEVIFNKLEVECSLDCACFVGFWHCWIYCKVRDSPATSIAYVKSQFRDHSAT